MSRRSLYLGAALVATLMFACATRGKALPEPVQLVGAVGCENTYSIWVRFNDGSAMLMDEDSGITSKQLFEKFAKVPRVVRQFNHMRPHKA